MRDILIAGLLQGVPPESLVFAMLISYALGFAGMLLAYLNWRRRGGKDKR
jgi:hypothetical protein